MEHQKITNLLNEANDSKFVTRKWNIVNDQSKVNYDLGNKIIYNAEVLKFNLCDYANAYILVTGDITVTAAPETQVAFKNCAPFTISITEIDGTTIDDAENLYLIMLLYNVLEYSSNYSETTRNLWLYSKDEATDFNDNIANTNNFKSFKYKAKNMERNMEDQPNPNHANKILKNTTIAVPLKYSNNI